MAERRFVITLTIWNYRGPTRGLRTQVFNHPRRLWKKKENCHRFAAKYKLSNKLRCFSSFKETYSRKSFLRPIFQRVDNILIGRNFLVFARFHSEVSTWLIGQTDRSLKTGLQNQTSKFNAIDWWYGMRWYGTVRYGTIGYGMVRYGIVEYNAIDLLSRCQ